ncbi:DUF4328 domain-containing protein [Kitasatospora sp. NPDC088391]|uniref:DUF4328 domain-containing protein n=1 Tax=Kitasatospora sp. NPDC088391 TaxID=3364074 RepID=UPI0037FD9AE3
MPSPAVYKSPRGLATAASVLLGLCATASLGSAVGIALLRADNGVGALLTLFASGMLGLLVLGTIGVFVPWLYRVRVNAEVIHPHSALSLPARWWTIGGWFIPFACLFMPWRTVRGVWQASAPTDDHGVPRPIGTVAVTAWWTTLMLGSLLARLGSSVMDSTTSATYEDSRQQALSLLVCSEVLLIAAAVLAIVVVRRLTAMQEAHAEAAHARAAAYWAQMQAV